MRFALLPAKPLSRAKSRLESDLADADRIELGKAMFEDVLDATTSASRIDEIVVVSADPDLLDLARTRGVVRVVEPAPSGLNAAANLGLDHCLERGASSVLILLTDLPLVRPSEIDAMVREDGGVALRIARSHDGTGTNAVWRNPPDVVPCRFGGPSLEAHRVEARRLGVSCEVVESLGLAHDVDTLADLERVAREGPSQGRSRPLARRLLAESRENQRVGASKS